MKKRSENTMAKKQQQWAVDEWGSPVGGQSFDTPASNTSFSPGTDNWGWQGDGAGSVTAAAPQRRSLSKLLLPVMAGIMVLLAGLSVFLLIRNNALNQEILDKPDTKIVRHTKTVREPWNCPLCNRTGNTGNYCGGCGQPAPGGQ